MHYKTEKNNNMCPVVHLLKAHSGWNSSASALYMWKKTLVHKNLRIFQESEYSFWNKSKWL